MKSSKQIFLFLFTSSILFYLYVIISSDNSTICSHITRLRYQKIDLPKLLKDGPKQVKRHFLTSKHNTSTLESYLHSLQNTTYERTGISCERLFSEDYAEDETKLALSYMENNKNTVLTVEDYYNLTENCQNFKEERGYMPLPESELEASFPLAYSILIYKDFYQVERLLRAIYAPQNFYCLHIDAKAPEEVKKVFEKIVGCFTNVFFPDELISVSWGHISIMQAEMLCLEKLLNYRWKYFINLSGQMFPLKSNHELVSILKMFNGANDIEGSTKKEFFKWFRQLVQWRHSEILDFNVFIPLFKSKPPHNLTIFTGTNQVILSRPFAVYFLHSETSLDVIEWFSDTLVPDEYIWPTLNHNPQLKAPGGYRGDPDEKLSIARLTLWEPNFNPSDVEYEWKCHGKFKRSICIFGVGDLIWIGKQPKLFANKFHSDYEWLGFDCMEEMILNKTNNYLLDIKKNSHKKKLTPQDGKRSTSQFENLTFYKNLPFVQSASPVIKFNESKLVEYYA